MKDIVEIIKAKCPEYKVVEVTKRAHELYYVGNKVETERATETMSTRITVYVHGEDGSMGDSAFPVYASMDEAAVEAAVDRAIERAKLVHNQPYALAEGGVETHEIPSVIADMRGQDVARIAAQAVTAAEIPEGGSINATEIFVVSETTRVRLSTGLDKTQTTHHVAIEAIPTHTDDRESVELYEWYESNDLNPEDITAEIGDKMREVQARHAAVKGEAQVVDIALRAKEIADVAEYLTDELSYESLYRKANAFAVGDDLQAGRTGDPLTITMTNAVKGSRFSSAFDEDGVNLRPRTVIEQGKAVATWGSSRFGQYVGEAEPSGRLRCIEVASGTLEQTPERYLECVSLSGIQLDVYNDYIGGEIRLAYLHEGDKVTPVTGISMSAQLSKVLPSLRLTANKVSHGNYRGPSLLFLRDVQIV